MLAAMQPACEGAASCASWPSRVRAGWSGTRWQPPSSRAVSTPWCVPSRSRPVISMRRWWRVARRSPVRSPSDTSSSATSSKSPTTFVCSVPGIGPSCRSRW